jgi:hypothetical protein
MSRTTMIKGMRELRSVLIRRERICGGVRFGDHCVSLSSWDEQAEQDRASDVLVYKPELARGAIGQLRDGGGVDQ